jgi:hypothetical protein
VTFTDTLLLDPPRQVRIEEMDRTVVDTTSTRTGVLKIWLMFFIAFTIDI